MMHSACRTVVSGIIAGLVIAVLSGLAFDRFGVLGGFLFNPTCQSPATLAVVPGLVMRKAPRVIVGGWTIMLIGYAFLYARINILWPPRLWPRVWRLGLMIWFFSLLFCEFQGPFNLLHEPLSVLSLELLSWLICALGAAVVIVLSH